MGFPLLLPPFLLHLLARALLIPNLIAHFPTTTTTTTSLLSRLQLDPTLSPSPDPRAGRPLLRLDAADEFHVVVFADLHYGEEEGGWGVEQDVRSGRVMGKILDFERPDLVVLNGDLITGENTFEPNSTKYLDLIVGPLVEHDQVWASTYGNHDSQYNLSRAALFAEESKYDLSYTRHDGNTLGITNYYLPIYPSLTSPASDDEIPVAILWFFDSQGGAPYLAGPDSELIPNWVTPSIVSWFTAERDAMTARWGALPSLAFVHIPPTAFLTVQQTLLPGAGQKDARFPGLNDDVPVASEGDGEQDVPFMQALVDTPGLHSVYSGHDHGNSWCGLWPDVAGVTVSGESGVNGDGPFVCFCKHTGYGGYGTWNRGARNLKLSFAPAVGRERRRGTEGMDVESWIRMESGEIVQRVGLNETYGIDVYSLKDGEDEAALEETDAARETWVDQCR